MTVHTHAGVEIARPVTEVWATVTDYGTDRRWRKGIKEMTPDADGAPKVGTRVREVLELAGRTYTTDTVVTEVGPGLSYRFAGSGTSGKVRGRRRVVEGLEPDSAVFTYDVEVEPEGIPRIAQPLLGWWFKRSLERDLDDLRDLLEAA